MLKTLKCSIEDLLIGNNPDKAFSQSQKDSEKEKGKEKEGSPPPMPAVAPICKFSKETSSSGKISYSCNHSHPVNPLKFNSYKELCF